jgi:ketosteroid isomerase-like protein
MSQENVELMKRAIDAVNRRDLDAFLSLMDDDVEIVSRIVAIEGGLYGHEGARSWWQNWLGVWPDYQIEIVEVRDLGDVTLTAFRARAHGAGSQAPFDDTAWQLGRFRGGKCVFWQVFASRNEAFEAAGVSE